MFRCVQFEIILQTLQTSYNCLTCPGLCSVAPPEARVAEVQVSVEHEAVDLGAGAGVEGDEPGGGEYHHDGLVTTRHCPT